MTPRHRILIVSVTFLLFLIPLTALSVELGDLSHLSLEDQKKAKNHFIYGKNRWYDGDYKEAANHFEKLYHITGIPVMIYHTARCYEELRQYKTAIRYFNKYMEEVPNAKTETDAQWRVDKLSKIVEAHEADTNFSEDTGHDYKKDRTLKGFTLAIGSGVYGLLATPNTIKRPHIPVDFSGHFIFSQSVMLSTLIGFSNYVEGDTDWIHSENAAEGHFYIGIGPTFTIRPPNRVSLYWKILFVPTWIQRFGESSPATWLSFQTKFGLDILLFKGLSLFMEAGVNLGPTIIPNPASREDQSMWPDKVSFYGDIGGNLGLAYTFR